MATSKKSIVFTDDKKLFDRLKKRYQTAKGIADLWQSQLEAAYHYTIPFRNRFYDPGPEFQGESRNKTVYDTTAVEAVKTFVSKMHEIMAPPQTQWAFEQVDQERAIASGFSDKDIVQAQVILNDHARRVFNFIKASNFDVSINECFFDLAIGTAALVINSGTDKDPLRYTSIPIDKLAIEESANGKIESWYRTWQKLKISELSTRWKNIQLTRDMNQDVSSDPDSTIKKIYEGCAYFPENKKPYIYFVRTDEAILLAEPMETNPGIVWRFQKTNNETWGRGPVLDALPSIISLNEVFRIEMAAANLNTFKPLMAFSDAVFNPHTFKLEPMSIIPIAPIGSGGQVPLIPFPNTADPQFSQVLITDLRLQIKRLLFAEEPEDSPSVQPQTAFALSLKQQTLAEKIGPLFSRELREFFEPTYMRTKDILYQKGLLKKPELNGIPIEFIYKSPLALSNGQKEIARFTQFQQLMQGIYGPEASQIYLNPAEVPYKLADYLQLDPRLLNSADAVAQTMQKVQDQHSMQSLSNPEGVQTEPAANPIEQPIAG